MRDPQNEKDSSGTLKGSETASKHYTTDEMQNTKF
jgi:hypothetical protein